MPREDLAAELSARKRELVAGLADRGVWGAPAADIHAGLEVVLDDFAVAVALGSAGLLDRAFGWWKVRVRSLGGDPGAVEQMPGWVASQLAELAE